jgi:hypothetical protein
MSIKDCLILSEKPSTPLKIRKFRRHNDAGERFLHYGTIDDYARLSLGQKTFGEVSDRGSDSAQNLIRPKIKSNYAIVEEIKAEKVYKSTKREVLGHSYSRGTILPDKFTKGEHYECLIFGSHNL